MIISILMALGMTLGVLIEALLGGPSVSTTTSESTTTSDKKDGAREWIKYKLKALLQLLGKLADKVLAALPGIIIHIFHDKDKEKISHLNIHHTVKIDDIPNTKATFSFSWVILFISDSVFIILISSLCFLLDSVSGLILMILISCFWSLLDLVSGFFLA